VHGGEVNSPVGSDLELNGSLKSASDDFGKVPSFGKVIAKRLCSSRNP